MGEQNHWKTIRPSEKVHLRCLALFGLFGCLRTFSKHTLARAELLKKHCFYNKNLSCVFKCTLAQSNGNQRKSKFPATVKAETLHNANGRIYRIVKNCRSSPIYPHSISRQFYSECTTMMFLPVLPVAVVRQRFGPQHATIILSEHMREWHNKEHNDTATRCRIRKTLSKISSEHMCKWYDNHLEPAAYECRVMTTIPPQRVHSFAPLKIRRNQREKMELRSRGIWVVGRPVSSWRIEIGTKEHPNTGTQEQRNTGTQERKHKGTQEPYTVATSHFELYCFNNIVV